MTKCPFKVGDFVAYQPSPEGYAKTVMHAPQGQPIVGQRYKVKKVFNDLYVVCEGFDDVTALYWTEFVPAAQ